MKREKVKIDFRSVSLVAGYLMIVEFLMMTIPMVTDLCRGEQEWTCFLWAMGVSLAAGLLLIAMGGGTRRKIHFGRREGFLLTSSIWVLFSLAGMLPFIFCGHSLGVADAFFETMSGFTTTGASVIQDVESLSYGILLWRSIIQWVGGLGIVIFMLAVLPALNQEGGVPMFNAESTGVVHDKIHPRIRQTAASLWMVYIVLTLLLTLLLWAGPMNFFDALCQAMTTMSTGGFSTRNASIAAWNSDYAASVISIFMLVGGVNFFLLYGLLHGRIRTLLRNDTFRAYMTVVLTAWGAITASLLIRGDAASLRQDIVFALFQVASTITTTGFSYGPYESWGTFSLILIIALMFCGACAGSTTGAIKTDRLVAAWKNIRREVELTLFPHHIRSIELNGRNITREQISKIAAFIMLYLLLTVSGALFMSAYGYNFTDCLFSSASCMGNNGLGYGVTGVAGGFGTLPAPVKIFFSLLMMTGRLEIFTVVVLASRKFWKY